MSDTCYEGMCVDGPAQGRRFKVLGPTLRVMDTPPLNVLAPPDTPLPSPAIYTYHFVPEEPPDTEAEQDGYFVGRWEWDTEEKRKFSEKKVDGK